MTGFAAAEFAYLQPPDGWTATEEDEIEVATQALIRAVVAESEDWFGELLDYVPTWDHLTDAQRAAVRDGWRTALKTLLLTTTAKDNAR